MRIFIDNHFFIEIEYYFDKYKCELKQLIHVNDLSYATINDNQDNVISEKAYSSVLKPLTFFCYSFQEILSYHADFVSQLYSLPSMKEIEDGLTPFRKSSITIKIKFPKGINDDPTFEILK